MKKCLASIVAAAIFWISGTVFAQDLQLQINANQAFVEGKINTIWRAEPNYLQLGASGLYNENDYQLLSVDLTFGRFLADQFVLGMGFRGLFGTVENEPEDWDASAAAFMGNAEITFPQSSTGLPIDMGISAEISVAPNPLCFGDTEEYLEFRTALLFHILEGNRGTIIAGFRYFKITFDDPNGDWEESDSTAYAGFRFTFN